MNMNDQARKGKGTKPKPFINYPVRAFEFIPLHKPKARKTYPNGKTKEVGKAPIDPKWPTKKYDSKAVKARCLEEERNGGIRLKADQLVVDIDPRNGGDRGWLQLCDDLGIDDSKYPKVITGSGGVHLYMAKPADLLVRDTLESEDYGGVEFKTKGRQVVAAGSIHPNGKPYKWDDSHPAITGELLMAPRRLLKAIERPARSAMTGGGQMTPEQVAAALAQLDAEDFSEHSKWLQVMQACHHASAGEARSEFVDWSTSDPAFAKEAYMIGKRWDSLHAEKNDGVTFRTLNKYLREAGASGFQAAGSVTEDDFEDDPDFDMGEDLDFDTPAEDDNWLEGQKEEPRSRLYNETQLPALLDFAERCLIDQGTPLYQMGGRLVHPVRVDKDSGNDEGIRRKAGSLTIGEVNQHRLREYVIQTVPFHKLDKKGKANKFAAPLGFATHYLARGDKWKLPVITGVIEAPTLRRDGSIIDSDGYDSQSGLLLDMGGVQFPDVPEEPTRADAIAALELLKKPFAGFPFVANAKGRSASRSVMLSAVLTALVRRTLHSAPMHGTSAPTMGTGKTLAIDVVSMIATGRLTTAMSQGANEEEDEKRLFSVLLQNDLILLIDNVKRPIEGDALCTVLTQSTWQSRILGESRRVEVPTNVLMMASGNNLTYKGDMTTRSLLCRLDAQMENPETRRFDIDLKTWVPKHRVELVVAGLTVLRAFVVAGRPGLKELTPFGRFEDWSNLVRGALVWLGEPDPCKTRDFIATDDPERNDLEQLFAAIKDNAGDAAWTAGELIKMGDDCSDGLLTEAIESAVPGSANAKNLGRYLHARNGKILGGMRLVGKYDSHAKMWKYNVRDA
ncbi:bifunctional DNA primase/polymerase [Bradyrhizobium sp. CCGE-LA001]|uniref:bifunctional DNA primase/polymerase n=1 Tax=Bradyrhizobium sp. CCGE-LA001 TaxID=1223566 RepID=UPI0002E828CE|nr:bifunctional DNA primase/polymerase [Bradyrhizobium sp. CCGE-LA001]